MRPPNSFLGISIVADAPECNDVMLNVKRPGVLRQYYGLDIKNIDNKTIERVAYRAQTSFRSEGSDPYNLKIKPFSADMVVVSEYMHKFLVVNQNALQLESVNLDNKFNSCTILLYHSLHPLKLESSMG